MPRITVNTRIDVQRFNHERVGCAKLWRIWRLRQAWSRVLFSCPKENVREITKIHVWTHQHPYHWNCTILLTVSDEHSLPPLDWIASCCATFPCNLSR